MKNTQGLDPLPDWCYIPRHRWTPYHYLMMWSRRYKLANFRTMYVGERIYRWMEGRVHPSLIREDGAILWAQSEFYLDESLDPVGIVTGFTMG